MIVDYLRTGRRQWARLYRDRPDVLTRIRWYRAAPTALQLPIPYTFGFNIYDDDVRFERVHVGFTDALGPFEKGFNHGQPGTHFHGDPDWFLNGAPFGAVNPDGPCVQWAGLYRGRIVVHGAWEQLEFRGRIAVRGKWSDVTDGYTGHLVMHGVGDEDLEGYRGSLVLHGTVEVPEVFNGVRATGSVSLAGAFDSQTLTLDSPQYDTDGYFDGGVPTLITVPADGIYLIGVEADGATNGTTATPIRLKLGVIVNGVTEVATDVRDLGGSGADQLETLLAVTEVELSAGDEITGVIGWVASGVSPGVDFVSVTWAEFRGPLP